MTVTITNIGTGTGTVGASLTIAVSAGGIPSASVIVVGVSELSSASTAAGAVTSTVIGSSVFTERMTVRHNGVVIHDNIAVNQITPGGVGADGKGVKGPLHLQDHGNPVRYRNVWVKPKQ